MLQCKYTVDDKEMSLSIFIQGFLWKVYVWGEKNLLTHF